MRRNKTLNPAATAWFILGGMMALGLTIMVLRELPAMRRELRIARM